MENESEFENNLTNSANFIHKLIGTLIENELEKMENSDFFKRLPPSERHRFCILLICRILTRNTHSIFDCTIDYSVSVSKKESRLLLLNACEKIFKGYVGAANIILDTLIKEAKEKIQED